MRLWHTLLLLLLPAALIFGVVLLGTGSPLLAQAAALTGGLGAAVSFSLAKRWRRRQLGVLEEVARSASQGLLPARPILPEDRELEALSFALAAASSAWNSRARALADEAHRLSAVLDAMSEGVWVTDDEGTLVRHNRALKEMLFAGQGLVGQRPLDLLRSLELHQAVLEACREGRSTHLEVSVDGVRPRRLAVEVTPLGQDLKGSTAVFRDITELRRLEQVRKDFVANVSHELRTPITAIRGYSETLRDGALTDTAHAGQMVEIIHRQSERLSLLVEDLLELSRLEAQELQLESWPLALAEAARRAADAVRPKAASRQIAISLRIPDQLRAIGDERAVEQVILNLLDNAVKYTSPGGRVEVEGRQEAEQAIVAVRDSGIGIEEKHLPRVFERFYRVDAGRSREMGGTGLGLSIVKHLVGAMHGEVKVSSRPGQGSTFTLFLPAAPHEAPPAG